MTMNISVYFEPGNPSPDSFLGRVLVGLKKSNTGGFTEVDGVHVSRDGDGLHINVSSLVGGPPQIVADLQVCQVIIFDQGASLRPQLGIYRRWGAQALADPYEHANQEPFWRIKVVGPDWKSAVRLYKAIRYRRIAPVEDWERGYVGWWGRFWRLVQQATTKLSVS